MHPDLPLSDEASLALVHEFNRIFDSDYVIIPGPVDEVDQAPKRSRFTGAGRPGYQHQSFGEITEILHLGRNAKLSAVTTVAGTTRNTAPAPW